VEITNICNLACSFCASTSRTARSMTPSEFRVVAESISPLGVQVYLHVLGEPLSHPNIEEILDIALENNLAVNITTNGTLIDSVGDMLLRHLAVRKVSISVHSLEGRGGESTREYLHSICSFGANAASGGRVIVNYRMWNGDIADNISDNSQLSIAYITEYFGGYDKDSYTAGYQSVTLADKVYLCYDREFEWPNISHAVVATRGKCLGGRDMLAVLADGTVTPCCLDSDGTIDLGNIFDTSLEDIMASDRYIDIVHGFRGGVISEDLCRRCTYRTRFDKQQKTKAKN